MFRQKHLQFGLNYFCEVAGGGRWDTNKPYSEEKPIIVTKIPKESMAQKKVKIFCPKEILKRCSRRHI